MTIAFPNTASAVPGNNISTLDIDLTVSSASGRVILAFPSLFDNARNATITSVTFDPGGGDEASFTNEAGATATNDWDSSLRTRSEIWYLVLGDGVSNGTYTIRFTASETCIRMNGSVWEVTGADTTDPIGATGSATGSTDTISVDVTTTAANSYVGMGGNLYDSTNFTPGSGDTEAEDVNKQFCSHWSGYTPAATTGTYTVSATAASGADPWAGSGVEILEAAAAAADSIGFMAGKIRKNRIQPLLVR
jgi:hypothetical protein